jgi:hypothetical protein
MGNFLRSALAVILGLALGSAVNMGLIMLGSKVIPPPAGADVATLEGVAASIHLFQARHFLFPLLAHALGTLAGAFLATAVVRGPSKVPAYVVGGCFLFGGIANVLMLPGPGWYGAVDILFAYLPMTWLGDTLERRILPAAA